MLKYLMILALPTWVAAGDGKNLDFDLLGAEAYRIEAAPSLEAETSPSRGSSLVIEAGLGTAAGIATAAALFYPLALSQGEGSNPNNTFYASGAGNAVGSAVGIWLGGKLAGRSGSPLVTLGSAVAGHLVGSVASLAFYNANEQSLKDAPIALGLTVALPTVLGLIGYNLTD